MLLKITHAPFVIAISAFEALESYVKGPGTARPGTASLGAPSSSETAKRLSYHKLGKTRPRPLALPRKTVSDTRASWPGTPSSQHVSSGAQTEKENLRRLVQDLSNQIEELKGVAAAQKRPAGSAHPER